MDSVQAAGSRDALAISGERGDRCRRHHIGAAPAVVPVHTDDGVGRTRATSWQLADRTPTQLEAQRTETEGQMRRAADALDFEGAARWRDELAAVAAELARRQV